MALWSDWNLMQKLHCTYSELKAEPAEVYRVFAAFRRGEDEVRSLPASPAGGEPQLFNVPL